MRTKPQNKPQNKQELINLVINRERRNPDVVFSEKKYLEHVQKAKQINKKDVEAKIKRLQNLTEWVLYDTN